MTTDDDVDALYGVPPEQFLARRKELVAAARKRGDAAAAQRIGGARRPTAAAWVVNLLVRRDPTARPRLGELTDALRAAHAAMDGPRIRELTGVQRRVIDGLVRAGLTAAEYADPPAALRNDVTDTLQAAVADPDVAARLGRLEKAERWSGFGEFGLATTVGAAPKAKPQPTEEAPEAPDRNLAAELAAAEERVRSARAAVESAARERITANELLSERTAKLATARRRYEKLLETLNAAERDLNSADADHADAEEVAAVAADRLAATEAELRSAESDREALR